MDAKQHSAPPVPTHDAAITLIRHFSPEVQAAYARLEIDRAPSDADIVILAIVRDHMPEPASRDTDLSNENLNLVTDLGFDSMAIAELVFFIEDLFQVHISNAEIMTLHTVGDLRQFVRNKLALSSA